MPFILTASFREILWWKIFQVCWIGLLAKLSEISKNSFSSTFLVQKYSCSRWGQICPSLGLFWPQQGPRGLRADNTYSYILCLPQLTVVLSLPALTGSLWVHGMPLAGFKLGMKKEENWDKSISIQYSNLSRFWGRIMTTQRSLGSFSNCGK